ncbi:MAG: extracellular solute-binding protein [Gammaproteobacteria bacterium]|nr:extracellular solute-binding protein [Gammaproteobacteria bacterium]
MGRWLAPMLATALLPIASSALADEELVVYSSRKEQLIKPLFDAFEKAHGIHVSYQTGKEGPLIERLKQEKTKTPADLLMLVDAGNLWYAGTQGILEQTHSPVLNNQIPAQYRDPDGRWFGLSVRARTIVYSTDRVKPEALSTYADLADPKWKGRLCLRTSKKIYNKSLVASMIHHHGESGAEKIVRGWVDNLAVKPFAKDSHLIKAIEAGACDVGIVNTYYFGRAESSNPDIPVALFWPDQSGNGVHVNISGAGITQHAPHKENAFKLLNWLAGAESQKILGSMNKEYPVRGDIPWDPQVASWGRFVADPMNLAETGKRQAAAVKLMQRARYK